MWYDHRGRRDHNVLVPGKEYSFRIDGIVYRGYFDQARQGFIAPTGFLIGRFYPIERLDAIRLSFWEWLGVWSWGTNLKTTLRYL